MDLSIVSSDKLFLDEKLLKFDRRIF